MPRVERERGEGGRSRGGCATRIAGEEVVRWERSRVAGTLLGFGTARRKRRVEVLLRAPAGKGKSNGEGDALEKEEPLCPSLWGRGEEERVGRSRG